MHATLSWRRVRALRSLRRALLFVEGWDGPVCRPWTNELSRRCDKRGNDVRVLDRTSFIPRTTQLDTYWDAMALLRDGVGVEACPHVMVKVMNAFVRIVVDQGEQVLHSTVRVRQTFKCFVRAAERAALEYIIEHMKCC